MFCGKLCGVEIVFGEKGDGEREVGLMMWFVVLYLSFFGLLTSLDGVPHLVIKACR